MYVLVYKATKHFCTPGRLVGWLLTEGDTVRSCSSGSSKTETTHEGMQENANIKKDMC